MTERERIDFIEKKVDIYMSNGGVCEVCGKHITLGESQLAHRMSKSKFNLAIYGKQIIHHRLNMVLTCSDKFGRCNDSVNINNYPLLKEQLIEDIRLDIGDKP